MKLTNEDVQEILKILDAGNYDELNLQTGHFRLSLRRHREGWSQESEVLSRPNVVQSSAGAAVNPSAAASSSLQAVRIQSNGNATNAASPAPVEVLAHLPGTFYRSPMPGAPPFVEVGSQVPQDSVVAIIETMKLMNAVHASTAGEIAEICCSNGQFVEAGAVLLRIRPTT